MWSFTRTNLFRLSVAILCLLIVGIFPITAATAAGCYNVSYEVCGNYNGADCNPGDTNTGVTNTLCGNGEYTHTIRCSPPVGGGGVNGACGATAGACSAGTMSGDNGATACGTTRTWTCNGSGGGTNANCSMANAACGGGGGGCYPDFEVYFGWSCPGPTESINVTCPAGQGADQAAYGSHTAPAVCNQVPSESTWRTSECRVCGSPPVNGACGSSHGGTFASAPSTNLCLTGSASAVGGSGPWNWTCNGSGGGTTASCSANKTAASGCDKGCGGSVIYHPCKNTSCEVDDFTCPSDKRLVISGSSTWSGAACSGRLISWTGSIASFCVSDAACSSPPVNGACSSAAGACSLGSVSGDNGATACSTTRTWNCVGSGGGTTANCSKANPLCAINGTCGSADSTGTMSTSSSNLCSSGTASAVSGTGPWAWTCNGANGGTNASCSAPLMQNGVCGSANGVGVTSAPSSNLCSSGTATTVSGSGPWSWNCNGANGGTNASCSAPLRVNAVCGSANGVGTYSAPSTGLCSPGTASAVSGSGPFTWACAGANGGTNASCSAPLRQDAVCGSSNGANFYAPPSTNLCSVGSPTAVSGSGPFTWTCNGINGGNNASCSANKSIDGVCGTANGVSTETSPSSGLCSAGNSTAVTNSSYAWHWSCSGIYGGATATCNAPQKVHGSCGPADGSNVYAKPTSGLCATGNATSVIGAGPFDWNCNGINGGNNVTCSANLIVNGQCGPANGQYSGSAPTSGLCSAGTATVVSGSGPFTWSCNGVNGGTASSCASQAIVNGACGPSNNTPTVSAPVSGLCSKGTASAVTGTDPWAWSCNGSGGGLNSNCTAPTPPPPPSFGGACPGP